MCGSYTRTLIYLPLLGSLSAAGVLHHKVGFNYYVVSILITLYLVFKVDGYLCNLGCAGFF